MDHFDEHLSVYYKKLFPYDLMYRWLCYGREPDAFFTHREFSFTLKDDVYLRYQSFCDMNEFRKEIQAIQPYKMDIGAIYSHRPKDHKATQINTFVPLSKELVFDIDMTDYDDVRYCCSGADICENCWPLMRFAVVILDNALREDFGFEDILWVYSGRRGIHCWVCDEEARELSSDARSAIAEYLTLVRGGDNCAKKVNLNEEFLHPSVARSIEIIEKKFDAYACTNQLLLCNNKPVETSQGIVSNKLDILFSVIPDTVKEDLLGGFESWKKQDLEANGYADESSVDKLSKLCIRRLNTLKKSLESDKMILDEIMLQYCYPRLDVHVSTGVNHLLKSPFCVHPKTGRICIPFDPKRVDSFQPDEVPTLFQLVEELAESVTSQETMDSDTENIKPRDPYLFAYKRTSVKHSIALMESFVSRIEVKQKKMNDMTDTTLTF